MTERKCFIHQSICSGSRHIYLFNLKVMKAFDYRMLLTSLKLLLNGYWSISFRTLTFNKAL